MKITRAGTTKTAYPAMLDSDLDGKADDSDKLDGKHASELGGGASNLTDQTSNRSLSIVYQNTTGKHLLVMVTCSTGCSTAVSLSGQISSDNNTYVVVQSSGCHCNGGSVYCSGNNIASITFVVPPNYYYKVTGSCITYWWEVEI